MNNMYLYLSTTALLAVNLRNATLYTHLVICNIQSGPLLREGKITMVNQVQEAIPKLSTACFDSNQES